MNYSSGIFVQKPSSNDKISYNLVSLINHDGDSLRYGHYFIDVFDNNNGIWWHCDEGNITKISDLSKGVYIRDIHKKICQAQQMYYLLFISEQAI